MDANSGDDSPSSINVYGDINQRSSIKGITDWKQISFISGSIFELKENYRNSKEIVEYTNKELNLSDIAIGINEGIPVKVVDFEEALQEISKGELCVILKKENAAFNELNNRGLVNKQRHGLVVLSPVLAKGQEFPKVLVFDKGMDNIDKYVSYTRAKSELIICKDF